MWQLIFPKSMRQGFTKEITFQRMSWSLLGEQAGIDIPYRKKQYAQEDMELGKGMTTCSEKSEGCSLPGAER